jgi:probable rRNA maturation factor
VDILMDVILDVQNAIESRKLPNSALMKKWIGGVLCHPKTTDQLRIEPVHPEITIRIVSSEESRQLNFEYRGKDKPTNILSFPFEVPEMLPVEALDEFIGDLVICESVLINEAKQQGKGVIEHWAHLVVHGTLHLLGFDHTENDEAEEMEAIEVIVLGELGIDNPYV